MERRSTFREEDQVVPPPPVLSKFFQSASGPTKPRALAAPIRTPSRGVVIDEEHALGTAHGCLGSNKQNRQLSQAVACVNEDRISLRTMSVLHSGQVISLQYIAVFDGHGGGGKASAFVSDKLPRNFENCFASSCENDALSDRVKQALEEGFRITDVQFYQSVMSEAARANVQLKGSTTGATRLKCCRYYNEDPCACLNPPIPANEGSTATIVILTPNEIICANVGDSDAYLVRSDAPLHGTEPSGAGGSPASNGSTTTSVGSTLDFELGEHAEPEVSNKRVKYARMARVSLELSQLSVTDTPVDDENNEDYQRIKAIAKTRSDILIPHQPKMPPDGILRSVRGARFNYVSVAGARALNMVRAFGNLGNKTFVDDALVEHSSPIISRPHIQVLPRDSSVYGIVLGTDGLWDNVDKDTVLEVMKKHFCAARISDDRDSNADDVARQCSKELLFKALRSRLKPDDVSVVVVSLIGVPKDEALLCSLQSPATATQ